METPNRPADFHAQGWIIVVEALAQWADAPDDRISGRRERAYDLIDSIAAEQGLPPGELVGQTDRRWPPPDYKNA